MTKFNFDVPALDIDGEQLFEKKGDLNVPLLVRDGLRRTLGMNAPGDEELSHDERLELALIAKRLRSPGVIDFSKDELKVVKNRINKHATILWTGLITEVLDKPIQDTVEGEK